MTTIASAITSSITNPLWFIEPDNPYKLNPVTHRIVQIAGTAMCLLCLVALFRAATGMAGYHPSIRNGAIVIHVVTVLPCIPLGAYLLLAPKGSKRHKMLGRIWAGLMVTTAVAITFIRGGTDFSWIHIFVPLTLFGVYRLFSTARAGDIAAHRNQVVGLYLGALMIPGLFSFMPGRIMGVWLFG